jgi:YfiR/HmsC-like
VIGTNRSKRRLTARWPVWRTLVIVLAPVLAAMNPGPSTAIAADNSDVETRIKAAFIYNFARFVEWPARTGSGSMRIGILGRGELASPLEEIVKGKSANGRPIEVTHIGAMTEADCCEILLIERSESKHVREIVQALAEKPVLTVCDGGNCLRDGVMIAFQIVEESVRFQVNQEAAQRAGLKVSSQLLKVAVPIAGKHL